MSNLTKNSDNHESDDKDAYDDKPNNTSLVVHDSAVKSVPIKIIKSSKTLKWVDQNQFIQDPNFSIYVENKVKNTPPREDILEQHIKFYDDYFWIFFRV